MTSRTASGKRTSIRALLLAVPAALMLMTALAAPALAQTTSTTESGYKQKPPVPKKEAANSGTAPAKEAAEPASSGTAPAASAASPASSSTLPFTGFDLRWVIGGGLLLIAAGVSIRVVQRR